jgi:hypothetical protein
MKIRDWQQGDVIVRKVKDFPDGERIRDTLTNNKTLALGEATGHHHSFVDADDNAVDVFRILNKVYVDALKPSVLKHQEHNPITIPPGKYEIEIVRETDHMSGVTRRVAD